MDGIEKLATLCGITVLIITNNAVFYVHVQSQKTSKVSFVDQFLMRTALAVNFN